MNRFTFCIAILLLSHAVNGQKNGCLIKQKEYYNAADEHVGKHEYQYDAKNNLVLEKEEKQYYDKWITSEIHRSYNPKNKLEKEEVYRGKDLVKTLKRDFDAAGAIQSENVITNGKLSQLVRQNGNFFETVHLDEHGNIHSREQVQNENGKEKKKLFNAQNELITEVVQWYNNHGYKTREEIKNVRSNTLTFTQYIYDEKNRKIREERGVGEKVISTKEFTYEGDKLLKESTLLNATKEEIIKEFSYNNFGLNELTISKGKTLVSKTLHNYDTLGNLIQEITYNDKGQKINRINYTYECK